MGITLPELPDADFNRELWLGVLESDCRLLHMVPMIDIDSISRMEDPVVMFHDKVTNRTKKARLCAFTEFLKQQMGSPEDLEDAMFYLEGALPYLPDGTMKRNIKRLLESTKHEQTT